MTKRVLEETQHQYAHDHEKLTGEWCFTIWKNDCIVDPTEWKDVLRMVYQLEKSPSSGQLHYQGVVEFYPWKRWKQLYDMQYGYWTRMYTTFEECARYCSKKDTRIAGLYHVRRSYVFMHDGTGPEGLKITAYKPKLDTIDE